MPGAVNLKGGQRLEGVNAMLIRARRLASEAIVASSDVSKWETSSCYENGTRGDPSPSTGSHRQGGLENRF